MQDNLSISLCLVQCSHLPSYLCYQVKLFPANTGNFDGNEFIPQQQPLAPITGPAQCPHNCILVWAAHPQLCEAHGMRVPRSLYLCVCVRWPGHLRSAAACYVFLAKKCSITHTHTRTETQGERGRRKEKGRSESDPRIQFGWRRRLNQTWQHSDRTCEGLASHCFGLDL